MRFALIEGKSAIAHLVHNFIIEPTPKTPRVLKGVSMGHTEMFPKDLQLKLTPVPKN